MAVLIFALAQAEITFAQPAAAGAPRVLVSSDVVDYMAPVWSPDGRFLAFTSTGYEGIWITDSQGDGIRKVAEGSSGFGFLWSEDSQAILARVSRMENRRKTSSLRIFRVEDGAETEITPYRPSMNALPVWGGTVESVLLPTNGNVEILDSGIEHSELRGKTVDSAQAGGDDQADAASSEVNGDDEADAASSEGNDGKADAASSEVIGESKPTFLLIGNQIAKVSVPSSAGFGQQAAAGNAPQQAPDSPGKETQIEYLSPFSEQTYLNLQVSPDGQKLAFELYGGPLYVMNTDGSGLIELGLANRPRWSPDSRYVVAMVAQDDGYRYLSSDIVAFSADGTHQVNLTSESVLIAMNPDWSPSGLQIVFDSPENGSIYVVDLVREN